MKRPCNTLYIDLKLTSDVQDEICVSRNCSHVFVRQELICETPFCNSAMSTFDFASNENYNDLQTF